MQMGAYFPNNQPMKIREGDPNTKKTPDQLSSSRGDREEQVHPVYPLITSKPALSTVRVIG